MAPAIIPTLARQARSLLDHTISSASEALLARDAALLGRDASTTVDPSVGVIDPHDINNPAVFALFGLIGVALVVTGVWFFFWAKNGGFHFRNDDWDDYKSTVLRRKGPNGTILTGATPSTRLGGGSVYKDVADEDGDDDDETGDARTAITGTTGLSGITAGVSDIAGREKRRKKREAKERERERRREEKDVGKKHGRKAKSRRQVGADGVLVDEEAEAEAQEQLRSYRHEKAARVGGINKEAEGSAWDGSTNPSHSHVTGSEVTGSEVTGSAVTGSAITGTESEVTADLMGHREGTPTSTPTKMPGGIRKVYSTADRRADREDERIRAEARRLQEKGRAAGGSSSGPAPRRNFSYQRHDSHQGGSGGKTNRTGGLRQIEEKAAREEGGTSQVPGGWAESDIADGASELGTKSYHHVIPGLSSSSAAGSGSTVSTDFAYQEEKRKKRGGAGHRRNRE